MPARSKDCPSPVSVFRYVELAQHEGLSVATAYGAFRKAGGTTSAKTFRLLWRLSKTNPFRFRGLD